MKKAYIIHGCCDREEYYSKDHPSPSNHHWIPWLQKQLLTHNYICQSLEFPKPYNPNYTEWSKIFETISIDDETSIIAHSCGCGFILKWLSLHSVSVDKLVLIAPWLDIEKIEPHFLNFKLDETLGNRVKEMHIFYALDDSTDGIELSAKTIRNTYKHSIYHEFSNKGHFTLGDMGHTDFPEILSVFGIKTI